MTGGASAKQLAGPCALVEAEVKGSALLAASKSPLVSPENPPNHSAFILASLARWATPGLSRWGCLGSGLRLLL